jgi:hypothetical protein
MRIISDYKDYYDGHAVYDKTDYMTKVWIRKSEKIKVSKYRLELFEERRVHDFDSIKDMRKDAMFLILAGKVIPFIQKEWYDWENHGGWMKKFFFTVEEANAEFKTIKYGLLYNEDIKKVFSDYPDMTQLCLDYKAPVILISPSSNDYKDETTVRTCETNVNLKELGISKIITAPQLYQMLDYFVSNVLVSDDMPHGVQTDIEKIEAHGFDKKISFRKEKKE